MTTRTLRPKTCLLEEVTATNTKAEEKNFSIKNYFTVSDENFIDFYFLLVPTLFMVVSRTKFTEVFLDSENKLMSQGYWLKRRRVKTAEGKEEWVHSLRHIDKENTQFPILYYKRTTNDSKIRSKVKKLTNFEDLHQLEEKCEFEVKRYKYCLRSNPDIELTYEEVKMGKQKTKYSLFSLGTSFRAPQREFGKVHAEKKRVFQPLLEISAILPARSKIIEYLSRDEPELYNELCKSSLVNKEVTYHHQKIEVLGDDLFGLENEEEELVDGIPAEVIFSMPLLPFEVPKAVSDLTVPPFPLK